MSMINKQEQSRKITGIQAGSASLVMVFAVLCLTILAVLAVVSANSELKLAEKAADAVTNYYAADTQAWEIFDTIVDTYDHGFTLPADCNAQLETVDGVDYLSYTVAIDDNQQLWVQVYQSNGAIQVAHWTVQDNGTWTAQETINIWGG